jgi:hypothetical protein
MAACFRSIRKWCPASPRHGQDQGAYLLARIPVVRGADLRDARPSQDSQTGAWETNSVLDQDAARRFERFTEANIGNRLAIVLDGKVLEAPHDSGPDQRQRAHHRRGQSAGSFRSGAQFARRFAAGPGDPRRRADRGSVAGRRLDQGRFDGGSCGSDRGGFLHAGLLSRGPASTLPWR